MVNAFALSAAFVGASLATLAQGATLRQSPLFGCVSLANGTLTLSSPGDDGSIAANFVAGHTQKSLITGETRQSVLATSTRRGADLEAGEFEFLNCTQSLLNRGFRLNVPRNFRALNDAEGTDESTGEYTFSWGVIRNRASNLHSLSVRQSADSKGRIDGVPLLHTKTAKTPVKDRTFIFASTDAGATYAEWYPFAGTRASPKSGVVYPADNAFGNVRVSTKHAAHAGSTFLALLDGDADVDTGDEDEGADPDADPDAEGTDPDVVDVDVK